MFDKSSKEINRLLRARGDVIEEKKLQSFCCFESFLLFNYEWLKENKLVHFKNCLKNYHKCGRDIYSSKEYTLDVINNNYAKYRNSEIFNNTLKDYLSVEEGVRLFIENEGIIVFNQSHINSIRLKEYRDFWEEFKSAPLFKYQIDHTLTEFTFERNKIKYEVDLDGIDIKTREKSKFRIKKGGDIELTILELYDYAKEMDEKIEKYSLKSQAFENRMQRMMIEELQLEGIVDAKRFNIKPMTNILGMVGSGKSTLMQVSTYGAIQKGYRVVIVLESIKDIHEVNQLFQGLGCKTAIVTGKSTIENQINTLTEEDDMCLREEYARYYTSPCPLMGSVKNYSRMDVVKYGKEPCFDLENENEKYVCPLYFNCPRKQVELEIFEADIIITTIHSMVYAKTPLMPSMNVTSFLEYVLDYIDVVMIDEVDKIQVTLDNLFAETCSMQKIIDYNYDIWSKWDHPCNNQSHSKLVHKWVEAFQVFHRYHRLMKVELEEKSSEKVEHILKKEKCISSSSLINQLVDNEDLKKDLYVYSKYQNSRYTNTIEHHLSHLANFENNLLGTADNANHEYDQLKNRYTDLNLKFDELKFIMLFICLEKSFKQLSSISEQLNYEEKEALNMPIFHSIQFHRLHRFLATAPLKHIYGYVFDKEKNDWTIFKQFALGRSIICDLSYLKIGKNGEPLGPNVVLLSGTSFAPGSFRHHIERDMNYVLEPNKPIQEFIQKTTLTCIPTQTKVSGVDDKERALYELLEDCKSYIQQEINKNHKLLFIVNSYKQCQIVKNFVNQIFEGKLNCFALVSDDTKETDGMIKRGDVGKLDNIAPDCQILVASATTIERGFNIVGSDGHSLFNALFFLVRPMDVPKDLNNIMMQINGFTYSYIKKRHQLDKQIDFEELDSKINLLWEDSLKERYEIGNMPEMLKREIVISRLVLIMQVYGRLLRITDLNRIPPHIYFADASFFASGTSGFSLLKEIGTYLSEILNDKTTQHLANLLYRPFYEALKEGAVRI